MIAVVGIAAFNTKGLLALQIRFPDSLGEWWRLIAVYESTEVQLASFTTYDEAKDNFNDAKSAWQEGEKKCP